MLAKLEFILLKYGQKMEKYILKKKLQKKKAKVLTEKEIQDAKEKFEKERKNHIDSILIHYLKFKKNFIYFSEDDPKGKNRHILKQYHELVFHSKRHMSELSPSAYYQIKKENDSYTISSLQYPKNASTFENYNRHSFDKVFIAYSIFVFCKYFNTNSFNLVSYDNTQDCTITHLINLLMQAKNMLDVELAFTTIDNVNFVELQNAIENIKLNISRAQYDYDALLARKTYINIILYKEEIEKQINALKKVIDYYNLGFNNIINEIFSRNIIASLQLQISDKKLKEPIDLVAIFLKINGQNIHQSITLLLENFDDDVIRELDKFKFKIKEVLKIEKYTLKEFGIFYPAYFFGDFTNNETRLVEIDVFKYHQSKKTLIDNASSFYKMFDDFDVHTDINNFLESDAIKFSNDIAYFDPFILLDERFYDKFYEFAKFLDPKYDNDPNQNLLIYDFLQILDAVQFEIIVIQQKNIFNETIMLEMEHDKSLKNLSLIKHHMKMMRNYFIENEDNTNLHVTGNILILNIMLENIDNTKNYSNITVDELGFANCEDDSFKNSAKTILDQILTNLNKNSNNSLKKLHDDFTNDIESELARKGIVLQMKHKYFIRDLIKHIIAPNQQEPLKATTYFNDKFKEKHTYFSKRLSLLRKYMSSKVSTIWDKL